MINPANVDATGHALSADDVYALTAYSRPVRDIVAGRFRNTLPKSHMANHDNFIRTDRRPDTPAMPCMNGDGTSGDIGGMAQSNWPPIWNSQARP